MLVFFVNPKPNYAQSSPTGLGGKKKEITTICGFQLSWLGFKAAERFLGDAPSLWPEESRQVGCSDGQWELSSPWGHGARDGAERSGGNQAAWVRAGEAAPGVLLGNSVRLECQIPV